MWCNRYIQLIRDWLLIARYDYTNLQQLSFVAIRGHFCIDLNLRRLRNLIKKLVLSLEDPTYKIDAEVSLSGSSGKAVKTAWTTRRFCTTFCSDVCKEAISVEFFASSSISAVSTRSWSLKCGARCIREDKLFSSALLKGNRFIFVRESSISPWTLSDWLLQSIYCSCFMRVDFTLKKNKMKETDFMSYNLVLVTRLKMIVCNNSVAR